mmetsp:Transcript_130310/g.405364  ORF Transcript_130310/g.405364 Transcript_130310/m.405364 type:complete len:289 (+) Transcript_130310:59-925(+)
MSPALGAEVPEVPEVPASALPREPPWTWEPWEAVAGAAARRPTAAAAVSPPPDEEAPVPLRGWASPDLLPDRAASAGEARAAAVVGAEGAAEALAAAVRGTSAVGLRGDARSRGRFGSRMMLSSACAGAAPPAAASAAPGAAAWQPGKAACRSLAGSRNGSFGGGADSRTSVQSAASGGTVVHAFSKATAMALASLPRLKPRGAPTALARDAGVVATTVTGTFRSAQITGKCCISREGTPSVQTTTTSASPRSTARSTARNPTATSRPAPPVPPGAAAAVSPKAVRKS